MTKRDNVKHKSRIFKELSNSPSGLTITDISKKVNLHRNTVSKYLGNLEEEGVIEKKEIGWAHLYFSKKREYLKKSLVNSFMKSLLYGIKKVFPYSEQKLKQIGHLIAENFEFPVGKAILKEFKEAHKLVDPIAQLNLFQKFYNSYDFFQDDLEITILYIDKTRANFRLKYSEYIEKDNIYENFFHIMCGIIERIYLQNLNKQVVCNVGMMHPSKNVRESYIEISAEILK